MSLRTTIPQCLHLVCCLFACNWSILFVNCPSIDFVTLVFIKCLSYPLYHEKQWDTWECSNHPISLYHGTHWKYSSAFHCSMGEKRWNGFILKCPICCTLSIPSYCTMERNGQTGIVAMCTVCCTMSLQMIQPFFTIGGRGWTKQCQSIPSSLPCSYFSTPSVCTHTFPPILQWDRMSSRYRAYHLGHFCTIPICSFPPMVMWDGMDSGDRT